MGNYNRSGALIIASLLLSQTVLSQDSAIDVSIAKEAFADIKKTCSQAEATLWNVSLCTPILLVDPKTRAIFTNEAANGLAELDGVWSGVLPDNIVVANTSVDWSGKTWAMVMLPLPTNKEIRRSLMVHESWHAVQSKFSFVPGPTSMPDHLASKEGRILFRLELRALAAALRADDEEMHQHALMAAGFRAERQKLTDSAPQQERALELQEGLAEYTGQRLASWDDLNETLAGHALSGEKVKSFVRSFAYYTGPAWGRLLDRVDQSWIKSLNGKSDLAGMYLSLTKSNATHSTDYGYEEITREEESKEKAANLIRDNYIKRFVTGPKLVLPQNGNMSFNPNKIIPLDGHGTVYGTFTLTASWGEIVVTDGILVAPDYSTVTVDWGGQTARSKIEGNGWTLTYGPEWNIVEQADGVMALKKKVPE